MKKNLKTSLAALGAGLGLVLASATATPAMAVATLPSTDTIYVISCTNDYNDFTLFSVDADGAFLQIGDGAGAPKNGKCPAGAAWDVVAQKAYFTAYDPGTDNMEVWEMDVTTGTPTLVSVLLDSASSSSNGNSISIDSTGKTIVVDNGFFYNADVNTGDESKIETSTVNPDNGFYYIIQANNLFDGKMYAINADNTEDDNPPLTNMLYTVDPSSGVVFGNTGPAISGLPDDMGKLKSFTFDSAGTGWAIVDPETGDPFELYSFDVATATFTLQGQLKVLGEDSPEPTGAIFITQPAPVPTLPNTGLNAASLAGLGILLALAGASSLVVTRRRAH